MSSSDNMHDIYTLMEEYERLYREMLPIREKLDSLKKDIKSVVLQGGNAISHGAVTATYRKGYTRVSWDSKGLDGYAVANPGVLHFRRESKVKSTVSISVKET